MGDEHNDAVSLAWDGATEGSEISCELRKERKMSEQQSVNQDERILAGLAHGSILLGVFTSGIGGLVGALIIWLIQKEKSAYVAAQALQALVYQVVVFLGTMLVWCCWGIVWLALFLPPLLANPEAYQVTPPPGLWIGLILMIIPIGVWGLAILYGLWGAVRCLGGHDFQYAVIGNWLKSQ
jgi:uncharacterized Tic20 family protein